MIGNNKKKARPLTKHHQGQSFGFTIIEVMMVLAVSGGLLVAATLMISGQQDRTRFSTNVREVENKLADILNDVETGFYPGRDGFKCVVNNPLNVNSPPSPVSAPGQAQGTNQDCIFLGKAVEFYRPSSNQPVSNFRIHTIIGRRQTPIGGQLIDVNNAPTPIASAKPTAPSELVESGSFASDIEIKEVLFMNAGGGVVPFNTLAVLAPLGSFSALEPSTAASNGKPRLSPVPAAAYTFIDNPDNFRGYISDLTDTDPPKAAGGMIICLRDSPGGRVAAIAVGIQPKATPLFGPESFGQRLATQAYFDEDAIHLGCSS